MLLGNTAYPEDVRVLYEARTLVEAGYEVAVICPLDRGQPRRERLDGVDVYRYPNPIRASGFVGHALEYGLATVAAAVLSARVLVRGGFDVVHAHNPPDTYGLVAAPYKLLGKRFVFDHHDLAPEMYDARFAEDANPLVRRALVLLEKLCCRLADHVIATNESYRAMEIERGGVSPDAITVVRNGPDLETRAPVAPDPELRARAGTLLGYVGVMGKQDGVEHLLYALRHLVYDLGKTDVLCVLIGRGDMWEELKRLARELGLEDHAWFTGFVPDEDLLRYLSTVDICVDPDPSNPFNDRSTMIKMLEYMALAKPIAAFDLPEHRVTAQGAAVYAQPNDDYALARAIAELVDDRPRREAMGALGRRRVEGALSWPHSAPRLLEAYEKLLSPARSSVATAS